MHTKLKYTSAILLAGALTPAALVAGGKEKTVYHEDFDRLGDYVECFNEGASISEWPASLKMLSFSPAAKSQARKGFFTINTPASGDSYAVFFRFLLNSPEKRAFGLDLYFGDKADPAVRTLNVDESGSYFDSGSAPAPADGMAGFAPPQFGYWIPGALIVKSGKASFYTLRNGKLTVDCQGELPAEKLIGWNITSAAPVNLDYLTVVENCERPYKIGDITDWLQRMSAEADVGHPEDATLLENRVAYPFAPPAGEDFCFSFKSSPTNIFAGSSFEFSSENGKKSVVRFSIPKESFDYDTRVYSAEKGAFVAGKEPIPVADQRIIVAGPGFRRDVYVRPRVKYRYNPNEMQEIYASFDKLPAASEHTLRVRLRPLASNWTTNEVWIDSKYAGTMILPEKPATFKADLAAGASAATYSVRDEMTIFADSLYLPLDTDGLDKPFGTLSPLKGMPHFQDVPFVFARPSRALNLAFCRENLGSFALECNGYLSKSPFEGMPSAMQFSVPVAQYIRAYALCSVDPNAPETFEKVVTARLTNFPDGGGRASNAMCESTRVLPAKGEPLPDGVTVFGETADGTPVYQVAFDFDVGSIQDITSMLNVDRLDLEFVGSLWEKDTYYLSRAASPSYVKQSAVQVYAATLEKAPAGMVVTPNRRNSLYYPDETPGATVAVTPAVKGNYKVKAVVRNAKDEICEAIDFTASEDGETNISFKEKEFGYYSVVYTISGEDGKPFITHRGSFVLLPTDTRKAGFESPYYSWNFRGAHGTPRDIDDWGDMYKRLGIRRTLLPGNLPEDNPSVMKYKLTHAQFPFLRPNTKNGQSMEEAVAKMKENMRDLIKKFPGCRTAIIFHESGGSVFPQEIIDGKTEITPKIAQGDTNRAETAMITAKAWREVDPGIRLIVGNSGNSLGILAQLFRAGYPADLIDAMGDETVGMTQPPERNVAYCAWQMAKLARAYGYDNVVPDAPWEWKSYIVRHQGEELQASTYVRTALIAHALNYTTIPVNGLCEMANSYYSTIWGDGAFSRWPLAYPARCAAAVSTLTLVLDQAKFVRMVPTGSLTTYCLEFSKPDGTYIYAVWAANADMEVKFEGLDSSAVFTEMLGSGLKYKAGDPLTVNRSPVYISVKNPIRGISAVNTAKPVTPARSGAVVAQPLVSADEVEIVEGKDPRIEIGLTDGPFNSFHRAGKFQVRHSDEEGGALEVIRTSGADCPELMQEYTFLKFPGAKPVPGKPDTIGLWVKGNSSWGKFYFEITDAEGEKWISAGTGGYGSTVYDWPEKASVNFDGWKFVEFPITGKSPVKVYSPGENEWQWQRDGNSGNGEIDYPITVTGLGVGSYPHTLYIREMKETSPSILIKDLSVY